MRIALVTPAGPGTRNGNRHTALRWAAFLRAAGYRVSISTQETSPDADLMLALHARRSHASISAFPREKPLVVALTGTDVYRDIRQSAEARESLELAHRLIVLQPKAAEELRAPLRKKVRVVVQSSATTLRHRPVSGKFRICVIGHLREEKDPLRIIAALPHVAPAVEVVHLGAALDPKLKPATDDARYRWLGSVRARPGAALAGVEPCHGDQLAHGRRRQRGVRGVAHRRAGAGFAHLRQRRSARRAATRATSSLETSAHSPGSSRAPQPTPIYTRR